jgi:uncharacterized protein
MSNETSSPCRVLSLDGGGAKGFYTLGVLREIEALWQSFDLIFGTSTGSIIAALLALGHSVEEIHKLYKDHVPTIMRHWTAGGKSRGSKSSKATSVSDRQTPHLNTTLVACESLWTSNTS